METAVITPEKVKVSNWVKVEVVGREVIFENKRGHDSLVLVFKNPNLFDPPCSLLHISKPEVVTLKAVPGSCLYDVYEPDRIKRHAVLKKEAGPGNCTSFAAEPSNPSGPIIVK